jgi:serine/threonine-protein kinase
MFFRGQIIGKYKILSTIGSGGFGTVYLAEDTWIDKKVALKVPHKQGVDFGELLREPRLLASLNHPNIVTILTAEKQENVFFIVMEFVPGQTLESIIAEEGALDLARALDFTCQICNAVDHAHRQGVLHRDLRPSNVIVSDSGLLKVADFGTSRFLEIAAHGTTVIGSPPYMAPEQFHGKAVFASDLYSLGVTMFQMLTGMLPYDTPSPADLDRLMRGELLLAPRLKNPKVPKSINAIVLKALAPDIHNRYQRATDLLDDVLAARSPRPTPRAAGRRSAEVHGAEVGGPEPRSVPAGDEPDDIQTRLRAREAPQARFCWHCRKPLHARTDRCPFCGEKQ